VHAAARRAELDPPVMWSKTGRDWAGQSVDRLIRRLENVRSGDIVLLHDGFHGALGADRRQTVQALEHWLPRWKTQGFTFVSVERSS
jgi:peptidoglycan/xylan/chitin deacetylase (PgdA/CDA1 family)